MPDTTQTPEPAKNAKSRFVQDTLEGITIGGKSVEDYVKTNPVARKEAGKLAAATEKDKGGK